MREGKRFSQASFTVHYRSTTTDHARLGIAVGRRVSLKATRRNTIKRIIRECFRRQAETLPTLDIVFNAKPPAALNTRAELTAAVSHAFDHARQVSRTDATSHDQGSRT